MKGIRIPALGSARDRVFRGYLDKEALLEAKKMEFGYMTALATPKFGNDANAQRNWAAELKRIYSDYVCLLLGEEPKPYSDAEANLMNYYENQVRESKAVVSRNAETGDISLEMFMPPAPESS